ncbi:MAG: hypothetical protein IJ702_04085, partial [Fretibacterium sp.]|nr:hypothetical protein [Fretibacterium sp.]
MDVKLTFSNTTSGDVDVFVSKDEISKDAPNFITLKTDVTSFDVKMAPLSDTTFPAYPLSIDKVTFSLGTAVVSGEASTDIVVTGIAPAATEQSADITIVISHDKAVSFDIVMKIVVPAKSGSDESDGGDEGDKDDTPVAVEPKETELTEDEVRQALTDVGISIPSDAEVVTSLEDINAASVDRGADETTETVGDAAKEEFTSNALSYLPEDVESVDVSTVKPFVLPRYKFEKKTVAVFDIPLKGVKIDQILMWIAKVVNESGSKLVVLNADDLAGGEAQFINPDTKAVVTSAWKADPTVTVAACFDAGETYDPVILAATETKEEPTDGPTSNNGSGGCDLGL